jgi:hypothetical protein
MKNDNKELYRQLTLMALTKKIVEESDVLALEEFHNNRPVFRFRYGEKRELLFVEFVSRLCERVEKDESLGRHSFEIAAKAYDLTLDKFSNLPGQPSSILKNNHSIDRTEKNSGSDCRYYYKAYLSRMTKLFKNNPPTSQIEGEEKAALCMQGLVRNHFYKSLLQAKRELNAFWSRYTWNVKGGTIRILLPVSIKGQKRREWLEKNIKDADPDREGEKLRVQEIINAKLAEETINRAVEGIASLKNSVAPLWSKKDEELGISLGKVVADEKAENIDQLRRSIRNLGKTKLKRMIKRIFNDVNNQKYEDGKVAKDFGLSKATFSRFAGSRWTKTESPIPDLWLNTAKVLSQHKIFKEVAMQTGYLKMVENISETNNDQTYEIN